MESEAPFHIRFVRRPLFQKAFESLNERRQEER